MPISQGRKLRHGESRQLTQCQSQGSSSVQLCHCLPASHFIFTTCSFLGGSNLSSETLSSLIKVTEQTEQK